MILKEQVIKILNENPELHYYGFGVNNLAFSYQKNPKEKKLKLAQDREQLIENYQEVAICIRFINEFQLEKIKQINTDYSSYWLKNVAEDKLKELIGNGSFIVAMIIEDFKIKRSDPNCYFNLSRKSITLLRKDGNF